MPLDPLIYNQAGRVNLASGLSDILNQQRQRETQRTQQEQTLAQLAQQKELRGYQLRDLKRKEEAIPQQQAHARSQELNAWLSDAVMSGRPQEEVMQEAILKGREIGVAPEITQRHVSSVFANAQQPQSRSDYAFKQAYPDIVAKQRAAAMFPKQGGSGGSTRGQIIFGNDGMAYLADLNTSTNQTVLKPYINPKTGKQFTAAQWDKGLRSQIKYEESVSSSKGQADVKRREKGIDEGAIIATKMSPLDRLKETARELRDSKGLGYRTGLSSYISPKLQGEEARNTEAKMTTLKSQIAQNVLQMYRSMSATGGAVGQVSDKEQELFQNNLAALDQAQGEEQFKRELDKIVKFVDESKNRIVTAYKQQYGTNPPSSFVPSENTQDDGWSDL